jgi:hypothetical protein
MTNLGRLEANLAVLRRLDRTVRKPQVVTIHKASIILTVVETDTIDFGTLLVRHSHDKSGQF